MRRWWYNSYLITIQLPRPSSAAKLFFSPSRRRLRIIYSKWNVGKMSVGVTTCVKKPDCGTKWDFFIFYNRTKKKLSRINKGIMYFCHWFVSSFFLLFRHYRLTSRRPFAEWKLLEGDNDCFNYVRYFLLSFVVCF